MGKIIGVGFGLMLVIVAIIFFPNMTDSIEEAASATFEETFSVTTGAGTTGICNLTLPLYNDDITEVTHIDSDVTSDFPSASSYDKTEDDLTVKSLAASTTRNLTVTYNTEDSNSFSGLNNIFNITPLLILLAILAVAGLAIWAGFLRGRG